MCTGISYCSRTIWLPKDQEKELENICKEIDDIQEKLKTAVNLRVVGCEQEIAMLEEKRLRKSNEGRALNKNMIDKNFKNLAK